MIHLKTAALVVLALVYGVLGALANAVVAPFVICRYLPTIWRAARDTRFTVMIETDHRLWPLDREHPGGAIIIHQSMRSP